jgi:hypothetical protein
MPLNRLHDANASLQISPCPNPIQEYCTEDYTPFGTSAGPIEKQAQLHSRVLVRRYNGFRVASAFLEHSKLWTSFAYRREYTLCPKKHVIVTCATTWNAYLHPCLVRHPFYFTCLFVGAKRSEPHDAFRRDLVEVTFHKQCA